MPHLLILVLLGIAPAVIAYGKGRNFALWWIYGAVLTPIAFIHALMLRKTDGADPAVVERSPHDELSDPDSSVPLMLKWAAVVAIAIVTYVGYRVMVLPEKGMAEGSNVLASDSLAEQPRASQNTVAQGDASIASSAGREKAAEQQEIAQPAATMSARSEKVPGSELPRTTIPDVAITIPPKAAGKLDSGNRRGVVPQSGSPGSASENLPRASARSTLATPSKDSEPSSNVTAVGEVVRMVQAALAKRGYDPGAPDGRADRQTRDAIRNFQADRKLRQTGAIDYSILKALDLVGPRVFAFKRPPDIPSGR